MRKSRAGSGYAHRDRKLAPNPARQLSARTIPGRSPNLALGPRQPEARGWRWLTKKLTPPLGPSTVLRLLSLSPTGDPILVALICVRNHSEIG